MVVLSTKKPSRSLRLRAVSWIERQKFSRHSHLARTDLDRAIGRVHLVAFQISNAVLLAFGVRSLRFLLDLVVTPWDISHMVTAR